MAGITVSGATIKLSSGVAAGLTSASTNAERVTAYGLLSYTGSASCIVTKLPSFDEFWETGEDDDTVCADLEEIKTSFKTIQKVAPSSVTAIFVKDDPLLILFNTLRASRSDVGTLEITHSNGTDKIWAEIEVSKTTEDLSEVLNKVKFMAEFFFKKKPVRN